VRLTVQKTENPVQSAVEIADNFGELVAAPILGPCRFSLRRRAHREASGRTAANAAKMSCK